MKLSWARTASDDRRDIRAHIARDDPAAALSVDQLFSDTVAQLVDYPGLGHPGRVEGTRELKAHRSYVIVYDVQPDTIRILRILHSAQQWPPAKS